MSSYGHVVAEVLSRPEFLKAWKEVGEEGIGSLEDARRIAGLLTVSSWHRKRLVEEGEEILKLAARWVDNFGGTEQQKTKVTDAFLAKLVAKLRSVGAAYLIMGAMIGTYAAALCLGGHEEAGPDRPEPVQ